MLILLKQYQGIDLNGTNFFYTNEIGNVRTIFWSKYKNLGKNTYDSFSQFGIMTQMFLLSINRPQLDITASDCVSYMYVCIKQKPVSYIVLKKITYCIMRQRY